MSMPEEKLVWALPKGSLNQEGRFVTRDLIRDANWEIRGYVPGEEVYLPVIVGVDWLRCITDRPQNMPLKLRDATYDIAICGEDWIAQYESLGNGIITLVDLQGGETTLALAIDTNLNVGSLDEFIEMKKSNGGRVVCYTELVGSAYRMLTESEAYKRIHGNKKPTMFVEGYGYIGDNPEVEIERSFGQTELGIPEGKIVLDISQTGGSLERIGGKIIDRISASTAKLYAGPHVPRDEWKKDKARQVAMQLDGVVTAREYDYVQFNIPKPRYQDVLDYLKNERLYADEPTVVEGKIWHQIGIYVPKSKWFEISRYLKNLGASAILRSEPSQVLAFEGPRQYEIALGLV